MATGPLPPLNNGIVTESVNGSKPSLNSLGKRLYPAVTDFNISHDGDWVLAGTTTQGILGVDIAHVYLPENMAVDEYINEFSLQLSAEEIHFLAGQGKQRLFDFYRIWTIKEAYVKAIGTGIAAIDLRQVCVELPLPDSSARVRVHGELVPLKFITGVLGDDSNYVYTLATSRDVNCKFRIVSLGELLA
ncbi:hypothetical protein H4218_006227 [Coemansia sp. IMI 209128]|nr:hypothetical protein H4218_006227 [Coemansia sp. IMI 209128]